MVMLMVMTMEDDEDAHDDAHGDDDGKLFFRWHSGVEAYRRAPREGPARQRQRRELSVLFRVA